MRKLTLLAVAGAVLAANAAVVRKMPDMSVVEGEMVATDSMKATAVRSSNTAVFSAALRESGEAIVSGTRLGEAVLSYVDERGVFASRSVMVVPAYWEVLKGMFSEDPEISVAIVGDKVVVRGATANVDTLRRVDEVKKLDTTRIVTQVSYSTAQIGELVRDFLRRSNVTNIGVNVVGREVCLSGRMYDTQSIEQLKKRVEGFVHDFPGISVNTDELRIYKQKILINIEFVAYNDSMSRNLGFSGPEAVTAKMDWNFGYSHAKNTGEMSTYEHTRTTDGETKNDWKSDNKTGFESKSETSETGTKNTGSSTGTQSLESTLTRTLTGKNEHKGDTKKEGDWKHSWQGAANAKVEGVQATINLLKKNGAAKTLYSTTLSTQSGIEAEFQNGGTIHRSTMAGVGASGGLESIEYGYIIKTTPLIIDPNTVNLDFSLDNKQPSSFDTSPDKDIRISRYQTKSKYLVRPGESIMLSGYKYNSESEDKKGTPWLSNIPWIGPYLFGNTANDVNMNEMLLVVTVDWALENDGEATAARMNELKERKVEVEMP
jgi:Flp pilus assembly secretin CpaC